MLERSCGLGIPTDRAGSHSTMSATLPGPMLPTHSSRPRTRAGLMVSVAR